MKDNVFCPIPWNFSAIRSNGDFRVCCHANQSESRGILENAEGINLNAHNTSFVETRNAPRLSEMRKKMLAGEWPSECVRCENEEKNSLRSRRSYERETWHIDSDYALEKTLENGDILEQDFPIHYIDLRFGNKCNLACRMCGPQDSSSWYNDYVKLTGNEYFYDTHGKVSLRKNEVNKFVSSDYEWHDTEVFWQNLDDISVDLKKIYMAGGEPLLIDKHYDFLEKCIEKDYAKNIILEYNTNLTILNEKITRLWSEFKQVRVGASIDGYGDVFEYQRHPAKWDIVYKNLQYLDTLPCNISSWLAVTVTNYNIFHLSDFIKWKVEESGFKRVSSSNGKPFITHHMCHGPKHLNIKSLDFELKQVVIGQFLELRKWAKDKGMTLDQVEKLDKLLHGIETFMMSDHDSKGWEDFREITKKLDSIRGENILNVVPEYEGYF